MNLGRIITIAGIAVMASHAMAGDRAQLAMRMDDMGAMHSVNMAIMDAYNNGVGKSVEIMPVGAWYPEAVKLLKDAPGLDVGVHIAITSEWENVKWGPLTQAPSLVDDMGYFNPMMWPNPAYPGQSVMEKGFDLAELEAEYRAQIERVMKDVPRVSHLSGHMGSLGFAPEVKEMVKRIAKEYGLGVVDLGGPDATYEGVGYAGGALDADGKHKSLEAKEDALVRTIEQLKPGKRYMFLDHPAYNDDEMSTVFHIGYEDVGFDRQGVTDLFKSKRVKKALEDCNVELISVGELTK
ncbi:MAG: ChbG/HpnK family deacetylase [Muribaculaceae bacterium]|nr:ChbG/HpnK family deacetylase [Muribaculaceae bacterium]